MLEGVHLILKEMEGYLSTTVYLHVTVFSLEKFSHVPPEHSTNMLVFHNFVGQSIYTVHRLVKKE